MELLVTQPADQLILYQLCCADHAGHTSRRATELLRCSAAAG